MTPTRKEQDAAWQTPTGYAASHCRHCDLGWTRTGQDGGLLTICLLDREPVLSNMVDCDRFEPKALKKAPNDQEELPIDQAA